MAAEEIISSKESSDVEMIKEVLECASDDDVQEIPDVTYVDKKDVDELVWLYLCGVPLVLVQILFYLRPVIMVCILNVVSPYDCIHSLRLLLFSEGLPSLHCVEFMAGIQRVTRAFKRFGYCAQSFERDCNPVT